MATAVTSRSGYEILKSEEVYRMNGLTVAPLTHESTLAYAYLRLEHEKILPIVFYQEVPTVSWWMEWAKKSLVLGCYRGPDLVGLGWVNVIDKMQGGHIKAEVGVAFFRKENDPLNFSRIMIEWIFDRLHLDSVYATTPAPNRAARLHLKRLGFDLFGPIPGYVEWEGRLEAIYIGVVTREKWFSSL